MAVFTVYICACGKPSYLTDQLLLFSKPLHQHISLAFVRKLYAIKVVRCESFHFCIRKLLKHLDITQNMRTNQQESYAVARKPCDSL